MDKDTLNRLQARAARLGHHGPAAEDLVQDCVLGYLERLAAGAQVATPLPYMMTSLRHASAGSHQAQARLVPLDHAPERTIPDAEALCHLHQVQNAIRHLPTADRALLGHVMAGTTRPGELALLYGVPSGTINSRLARARKRLRQALGET